MQYHRNQYTLMVIQYKLILIDHLSRECLDGKVTRTEFVCTKKSHQGQECSYMQCQIGIV